MNDEPPLDELAFATALATDPAFAAAWEDLLLDPAFSARYASLDADGQATLRLAWLRTWKLVGPLRSIEPGGET